MLLAGLLISSLSLASDYQRAWVWETSSPPDIDVCEDAQTTIETVNKAVKFWRKKGYRLGAVYRSNSICQKDYHPSTIIIHGEQNLDTAAYNAYTTPWFNPNTGKLVSAVVQFNDSISNVQELVNHEIGHGLGLSHTFDHKDVMYGGQRSY